MGIVNTVHILYICKNKTLFKNRKKMGNFLRFIKNSGNTIFKNASMRVVDKIRRIALSEKLSFMTSCRKRKSLASYRVIIMYPLGKIVGEIFF